MKFMSELYVSEGLKKKKDKVIEKLIKDKFQPNIHLITRAANPKDQLDIINSIMLLQKDYPKDSLFVVGLAKGYEDAINLAKQIITDANEMFGKPDVSKLIRAKSHD
ncbi:MAG: hypothetical protein LBQ95_07740 [Lachnospiraceae bacterium]|jgi:hypothetical protein|nr:hypothetical protein [Lachnospiraceae bacterium]